MIADEILLKIDPIPPFRNGVVHQQSNKEAQHPTRRGATYSHMGK